MALTDKTPPPQPVPGSIALPSVYPRLPDDILSRFPSMKAFQKMTDDHYRRFRSSLYDFQDQLGFQTSKAITAVSGTNSLLRRTKGELQAEIRVERDARVDGDEALAFEITTISAAVGDNTAAIIAETTARVTADEALATQITSLTSTVAGNTAAITLEATTRATADSALSTQITSLTSTVDANTANITTILTTYATLNDVEASRLSAISVSNGHANAVVSTEESARITADGHLSGKYTLKVITGNVVTGMNITSATDGGTDISEITFHTDNFNIISSALSKRALLSASAAGFVFGADLLSDNYVTGSAGWRLTRSTGIFECTNGIFRGELYSTSGTIGGFSIGASSLTATNFTLDAGSGEISVGTANDRVAFVQSGSAGELAIYRGGSLRIGLGATSAQGFLALSGDSNGAVYMGDIRLISWNTPTLEITAVNGTAATVTASEFNATP